jgi:hypothetical protein
MGAAVPRTCGAWPIGRDEDDRLDPRQGTPLGIGRKGGEQNQAIGRLRGGRNTKIHAIADAKGRLLSILLSGGEAHDCPPAEPLIRRTKPARKLTAPPCANGCKNAALSPSFPTSRNGSSPSASTGGPTNSGTAFRMPSAASRTFVVSRPAMTGSPETSWHPFALSPLLSGGSYESRP